MYILLYYFADVDAALIVCRRSWHLFSSICFYYTPCPRWNKATSIYTTTLGNVVQFQQFVHFCIYW